MQYQTRIEFFHHAITLQMVERSVEFGDGQAPFFYFHASNCQPVIYQTDFTLVWWTWTASSQGKYILIADTPVLLHAVILEDPCHSLDNFLNLPGVRYEHPVSHTIFVLVRLTIILPFILLRAVESSLSCCRQGFNQLLSVMSNRSQLSTI